MEVEAYGEERIESGGSGINIYFVAFLLLTEADVWNDSFDKYFKMNWL